METYYHQIRTLEGYFSRKYRPRTLRSDLDLAGDGRLVQSRNIEARILPTSGLHTTHDTHVEEVIIESVWL